MRARTLEKRPLRWLAIMAGLLWLGGFELMPTLHMGLHGALGEHHHGVGGHDAHHHGTAAHQHPVDPVHQHGDIEHEQPDAPSEHGKNSLAHRDLAAEQSPPAVPPVPEALLAARQPPPSALRSLRVQRQLQSKKARGPPSTLQGLPLRS